MTEKKEKEIMRNILGLEMISMSIQVQNNEKEDVEEKKTSNKSK